MQASLAARGPSLPVHRHLHSKRGTVYAYTAEIDEWLGQRSTGGNGNNHVAVPRLPALGSYRIGIAFVVLLAMLAIAFWIGTGYTLTVELLEPAAGSTLGAAPCFDDGVASLASDAAKHTESMANTRLRRCA